jgi:hypothetical protein
VTQGYPHYVYAVTMGARVFALHKSMKSHPITPTIRAGRFITCIRDGTMAQVMKRTELCPPCHEQDSPCLRQTPIASP